MPVFLGPKVSYYRGDTFNIADRICDDIIHLLQTKQIIESDIFILSNSIKQGQADKHQ